MGDDQECWWDCTGIYRLILLSLWHYYGHHKNLPIFFSMYYLIGSKSPAVRIPASKIHKGIPLWKNLTIFQISKYSNWELGTENWYTIAPCGYKKYVKLYFRKYWGFFVDFLWKNVFQWFSRIENHWKNSFP